MLDISLFWLFGLDCVIQKELEIFPRRYDVFGTFVFQVFSIQEQRLYIIYGSIQHANVSFCVFVAKQSIGRIYLLINHHSLKRDRLISQQKVELLLWHFKIQKTHRNRSKISYILISIAMHKTNESI